MDANVSPLYCKMWFWNWSLYSPFLVMCEAAFSASSIVTPSFLYLYIWFIHLAAAVILWGGGWSDVRLRLDIRPAIFMLFVLLFATLTYFVMLFLTCFVSCSFSFIWKHVFPIHAVNRNHESLISLVLDPCLKKIPALCLCLHLHVLYSAVYVCGAYLHAARSEPRSSRGAGVPAWGHCSAAKRLPPTEPALHDSLL